MGFMTHPLFCSQFQSLYPLLFSLPTEKFMRGQGEKITPAEKGN